MKTTHQRWFESRNGRYYHTEQQERHDSSAKRHLRTDLAVEANLYHGGATSIPGIDVETETLSEMSISRIAVTTLEAAKRLGKGMGHYTTLEVPELRKRDPELQEQVALQFAEELKKFMKIGDKASVLVVGLGNWNVTPDSLGPLVAEKLLVTRHLFALLPDAVQDGFRPVSAFAPGVLGITGMETSEIVSGIVDRLKPDLVIAIDALAARSLERVNTTVQIADTGIQPGGGVGNHRKALNKESLGVDVLALGVPTVVDAATIAGDAIELLLKELGTVLRDPIRPNDLVAQVLKPLDEDHLMVTPKEVDEFVDDMAYVLALALNYALHPGISFEEAKELTRG